MTKDRRSHHARLHRHRSAIDGTDQLAGGLRRWRVPDQMDRADPAQSRRHARAGRGNSRQRRCLRRVRHCLSAQGNIDHTGMAGCDQCAILRPVAVPRPARRSRRTSRRRPHAGGPGNHPLHRILRHRSHRQVVFIPRSLGWRLGRPLLRRRQRCHSHRAGLHAISRPNLPRRGFRFWSKGSRCARIPAAPENDAAVSVTRSITVPSSIAAPS